jgi:ribosomal protein S18 acetylase RimI-like enzyme
MRIVAFNKEMVPAVAALWNAAVSTELPYKPFTPEGFIEKFMANPHFDYNFAFAAEEDGEIVGFAQGVCKKTFLPGETNENTPGYITSVAVHTGHRNRGTGTALLKTLEEAFRAEGKSRAEFVFFNPINLEWAVPGTDGHEHPNAPGVLADSEGYAFLSKRGYSVFAEQFSYHRDLSDMKERPEKITGIIQKMADRGITIETYKPDYHTGLDALFDNLGSEHWRAEVNRYLIENPEYPLLVVSDGGKAAGFAGPVYPQPNGRGFFAGIGVHSAYGGLGIGTALCYRLCETERDCGAAYMTLFTGVNNPARKIYESAGFTVTARWADMGKGL